MESSERIVHEVQNRVLAIVPDARIILYGSRARGDARKDSDWDFLVLLKQVTSSLEKEILQSVYEFELASQQSISVFITTLDQARKFKLSPFYQEVTREGIDLSSSESHVEEPDDASSYSLAKLVDLRLQKADMALADAQLSFDHGSYSLAMNRLYYASFYALTALFLKEDLFSKTHQGVKNLFHLHLVLTGRVSKEYGSLFNELFDKRMKGDYSLIYAPDELEVESYFEKVKEFLSVIRGIIETKSE